MQTLIQVICKAGPSLRDKIVNDNKSLSDCGLIVAEKRNNSRPKGWSKILSTLSERRGAINIEWDAATNILICRVVNRGNAKPHLIAGDFVDYLLRRHSRRIQTINIIPR